MISWKSLKKTIIAALKMTVAARGCLISLMLSAGSKLNCSTWKSGLKNLMPWWGKKVSSDKLGVTSVAYFVGLASLMPSSPKQELIDGKNLARSLTERY